MSPSPKAVETELVSVTDAIFASAERDGLSVNQVRRRVEDRLALDAGFLDGGDWKARSKEVVKERVVSLRVCVCG